MNIKPGRHGTSIAGIKPETVIGILIANDVFKSVEQPCELSSGLEGKHSRNSLHYAGLAFDVSARDVAGSQYESITYLLSKNLGDEFDVIFETDHWHIEFQPERRLP